MSKLLVIDNYDSFTFNLVQMFMHYDLDIEVHRSDSISIEKINSNCPDYILISPGPKDPEHAGISMQVILSFYHKTPILGVCLGMQCINEIFKGRTIRANLPVHGKTSQVYHNNKAIFAGLPQPLTAARYHSLAVEPAPNTPLRVTAWSEDQIIMGLAHPEYPLYGLQFHPESFLTPSGSLLIENYLEQGTLYKRNYHERNQKIA